MDSFQRTWEKIPSRISVISEILFSSFVSKSFVPNGPASNCFSCQIVSCHITFRTNLSAPFSWHLNVRNPFSANAKSCGHQTRRKQWIQHYLGFRELCVMCSGNNFLFSKNISEANICGTSVRGIIVPLPESLFYWDSNSESNHFINLVKTSEVPIFT